MILNIEKGTFISISERRKKNSHYFVKDSAVFSCMLPFALGLCSPLPTSATLALWTHWALWKGEVAETQLWNTFYMVAKRTSRSQANNSQRIFFSAVLTVTGHLCCITCCAGGHCQDRTPKMCFSEVQKGSGEMCPIAAKVKQVPLLL